MRQLVSACALLLALSSPVFASFDALLGAARTKDLEAVRNLLEHGSDPNPRDETYTGYTPLMFAAQNGNAEMTRLLLAAGAQTERRDHNGERALEWATRAYYLHTFADVAGCVRLLLEAGSPPDSDDRLGITPLMHASQYGGDGRIIRLLLEAGADPNRVDHSNSTALHRAAWRDGEAVALLLAAGADPNIAELALGGTPLHQAAAGMATANARLLLSAGAATEPRYYGGQSALFIAAATGAAGVVMALVEAGADVDARNDDGLTPVLAAIGEGGVAAPGMRVSAVMALAERTTDLDRAFAAAIGRSFDAAADRLLARGAHIDAVDAGGRSALAASAARLEGKWFDRLLAEGADLASHGGEAMGAAAGGGFEARVARLIDMGVTADASDVEGVTAVMRAAAAGHVGMVQLLVERGADRSVRDRSGRGVLDHMAAGRARYEEMIARAEASRAMIDVSAERETLARLLAAHPRIAEMLDL